MKIKFRICVVAPSSRGPVNPACVFDMVDQVAIFTLWAQHAYVIDEALIEFDDLTLGETFDRTRPDQYQAILMHQGAPYVCQQITNALKQEVSRS